MEREGHVLERARGMLFMLGIQFALGVVIQAFSLAPSDLTSAGFVAQAFGWILFGLHVLLAFGLLIVSTILLVRSHRDATLRHRGVHGFVAIVLAFVSGLVMVMTAGIAREIGVLLMTLGFLAAAVAYARFYVELSARPSRRAPRSASRSPRSPP